MMRQVNRWVCLLAVLGLMVLSASVLAAPPGNWTNYNVDFNGEFETFRLGDPAHLYFEGHGNAPDDWPATLEFYVELQTENGAYACSLYNPSQSFADDGETLSLVFDGMSDCGTDWQLTLVIDYDAVRYRAHTNETGGQVKVEGVRDEGADISLDILELNDGWEHIVDEDEPNTVFYQAVTEQFHNTGSPGNPQP